MNQIFQPFVNKFMVDYFDDIFIYSNSLEIHLQYLQSILETLRAQWLCANMKKCYFMTNCIHFLGFLISTKGVEVYPIKIEDITSWPTPKSFIKIRQFHGLASFYM